jgi:hypothetical protein
VASILSCLVHIAARSGRSPQRLAELNDHTLRDIGLRRTDLYALRNLHGARMKAACCRVRALALRLLAGRWPACSC